MHAVRLLRPARQPFSIFLTRTPPYNPITRTPILCRFEAPRSRRLFSQTARRGDWWPDPHKRDPREQLQNAKPLLSSARLRSAARSPRVHVIAVVSFLGALAFYFSNLETVPISGRRRFNCYSEEYVKTTSDAQVKHIEYEVERSGAYFLREWDPRTRMVKRVLNRLIPYSGMADAEWEVRVIEDPHTANAMVLPGGKIFVYSGLIPIARSEAGLAAVLGHEIAHCLAQHMGEQMSSQIGKNVLLWSVIFLSGGLATPILGGTLLDYIFSKPMSRKQESEADFIGLMMMAEACYDPQQAINFWRRMESAQQGEPPEWLSTHPSNHNRIQKIQEWMPQAIDKRQESDCQGTSAFADMFKKALQREIILESRPI
ncbi:peptidase family M48-domain-containing protein [Xylariaceae sp. FL0016]|nr:peptidase family M48-domain-containing protein [Xylariaceae sp. FL0016]